jgi:dienelactone hydrolase
MNAKFSFLILILAVTNFIYGNTDFTGYWNGGVERLGAIQPVEFNFYNDNGILKGTYNIPDMGLFDEPVEELKIEFSSIKFKIFMGYFDASLDTVTGEITGTNKNWNPSINIHLKKMLKPGNLFTKEYISFYNKDIRTAATLFKPIGIRNFPVVIIIHGSGEPQSRRNWRYRYFAYLLANNGIGALIYDKRGIDSSTGNKDADLYELSSDVESGVKYLLSRNDVEKNKIGVLGISRGGWVTEICASKFENIGFAILFVGPSVSVWEQQLDAVEFQMKSENYSQTNIDSALDNNKQYFETVNDKNRWEEFKKSLVYLKDKTWNQYIQLPETYNDSDMIWWRKNDYNPEKDLMNTKCTVLSIMGESDVLVPPQRNYNKMQKYLSASGQPFEIKIIPGLPHNIHFNQTLEGGEWNWPKSYWVWPKKSILLEETIISWLKKICGFNK